MGTIIVVIRDSEVGIEVTFDGVIIGVGLRTTIAFIWDSRGNICGRVNKYDYRYASILYPASTSYSYTSSEVLLRSLILYYRLYSTLYPF